MATIKHARTLALQATSPRIVAVALPTNVKADWTNNVNGTGKPADYATVRGLVACSARVRACLMVAITQAPPPWRGP